MRSFAISLLFDHSGNGTMEISSHKELRVWKKGMNLVQELYDATTHFPSSERYGLTSQLRRATVSIPTNIAEGFGRESSKSFISFLKIARGSALEAETLLLLAQNLGYMEKTKARPLLNRIEDLSKMLHGLIKTLKKKESLK